MPYDFDWLPQVKKAPTLSNIEFHIGKVILTEEVCPLYAILLKQKQYLIFERRNPTNF